MICFQISIFEPLETTNLSSKQFLRTLWFAFKLVSLNHWKQLQKFIISVKDVVICFQISIFEPLETTTILRRGKHAQLWFAFKLVSLNHWKQLLRKKLCVIIVVICFQISIFEPLETTTCVRQNYQLLLWFAFKLVSLNHWKQHLEVNITQQLGCDLLSN